MLSAAGLVVSFWTEDGEKYKRETKVSKKDKGGHTKEILKNKVCSERTLRGPFLIVR